MPADWFESIAAQLRTRIATAGSRRLEFVAGVRVNGAPHIGTYLTLASAFVFASRAGQSLGLPCTVGIHFLDNDPVPAAADQPSTHFHCVFQVRTAEEGIAFIRDNYASFLEDLSTITGCPYKSETYSTFQSNPEFRSMVLRSLPDWRNIKYYVSGMPLVEAPTGVRGIGFPCPHCGLFSARLRPSIELLSEKAAALTSECCSHGEYCTVLTPLDGTFLNLETTYRNVIKELLALKNKECQCVIMKGADWADGLRSVDLVLRQLGVSQEAILPRFLLPVVRTDGGVKLSKSAIQLNAGDFGGIPSFLLDMKVLRKEIKESAARIFDMAEVLLSSQAFVSRQVSPGEILGLLRRDPP